MPNKNVEMIIEERLKIAQDIIKYLSDPSTALNAVKQLLSAVTKASTEYNSVSFFSSWRYLTRTSTGRLATFVEALKQALAKKGIESEEKGGLAIQALSVFLADGEWKETSANVLVLMNFFENLYNVSYTERSRVQLMAMLQESHCKIFDSFQSYTDEIRRRFEDVEWQVIAPEVSKDIVMSSPSEIPNTYVDPDPTEARHAPRVREEKAALISDVPYPYACPTLTYEEQVARGEELALLRQRQWSNSNDTGFKYPFEQWEEKFKQVIHMGEQIYVQECLDKKLKQEAAYERWEINIRLSLSIEQAGHILEWRCLFSHGLDFQEMYISSVVFQHGGKETFSRALLPSLPRSLTLPPQRDQTPVTTPTIYSSPTALFNPFGLGFAGLMFPHLLQSGLDVRPGQNTAPFSVLSLYRMNVQRQLFKQREEVENETMNYGFGVVSSSKRFLI